MRRILLRRAQARDLPAIEPWYGEAARSVFGAEVPAEEPDLQGRFARGNLWVIQRDRPVGVLEGVPGCPVNGWVSVGFVALEGGQRGWGYGSEAVREFEARYPHSRFLAQVAPLNGLALYFWLRMGYRPARAEEVFWRPPGESGIIAMIREQQE